MPTLNTRKKEPADAGAEQRVVDAFRRILRALRLSANAVQASLGVTPAQLYLLRHLAADDGASLTDLARSTLTDRSSVAEVVDRLVQQGFAERGSSAVDRRRASVRITAAGMQIVRKARPAPTDLIVGALSELSPDELARLSDSLDRLVAAMGLEDTPPDMLFEERQTPRAASRADRRG